SALVSWCDGFLYGLGVTAGQAGLEEDKDGREFLSDLSTITQLAVNTAGGEDNEVAYAEIIEYVRTGVMVLHEMALPSSGSPRSGKPESS
ncbi:MAG: YecA family protein, partial [Gammaproteobacteria bacterium]|nr:YecA family protein [Gammaproteobacteria bacterium]